MFFVAASVFRRPGVAVGDEGTAEDDEDDEDADEDPADGEAGGEAVRDRL